jgi:hypothetical protein
MVRRAGARKEKNLAQDTQEGERVSLFELSPTGREVKSSCEL